MQRTQQPPPACPGKRLAIVFTFGLRGNEAWVSAATALSAILAAWLSLILAAHLVRARKGFQQGPVILMACAAYYTSGPSDYNLIRSLQGLFWTRQVFSVQFAAGCAHFAIVFLLGPVVAVVSVERMIVENRLVTAGIADSAGQLIAVFTGASNLLIAPWEAADAWMELGGETPDGGGAGSGSAGGPGSWTSRTPDSQSPRTPAATKAKEPKGEVKFEQHDTQSRAEPDIKSNGSQRSAELLRRWWSETSLSQP